MAHPAPTSPGLVRPFDALDAERQRAAGARRTGPRPPKTPRSVDHWCGVRWPTPPGAVPCPGPRPGSCSCTQPGTRCPSSPAGPVPRGPASTACVSGAMRNSATTSPSPAEPRPLPTRTCGETNRRLARSRRPRGTVARRRRGRPAHWVSPCRFTSERYRPVMDGKLSDRMEGRTAALGAWTCISNSHAGSRATGGRHPRPSRPSWGRRQRRWRRGSHRFGANDRIGPADRLTPFG